MERYLIGEMAELNCVSARMLRSYHDKGLVEPQEVDEETGYRYYTLEQASAIDMVQMLQTVGFSLDEIGHIANAQNLGLLDEMLSEKLNSLREEEKRIRGAVRLAEDLKARCRISQSPLIKDEIMLEQLAERNIVLMDIPPLPDIDEHDGKARLQHWELTLRGVKRKMLDAGLPLSLFHNVGGYIGKDELHPNRRWPTKAFFFLSDEESVAELSTAIMPAGQYLTLYTATLFEPDGRLSEFVRFAEMMAYAEEKGFTVCGAYYAEPVAETPAFQFQGRDYLLKLYLQVSR